MTSACQPGSITVVWFGSEMMAGPAIMSPGARSSRTYRGVSRHCPALNMRIVRRAASGAARVRVTGASVAASPPPVASTEMVSTTSSRPGIRNE
ncbi:Uncharacterised protein [Bordetella pertussis]|nr:Uncharacterised protein [Bordetella pertussis]